MTQLRHAERKIHGRKLDLKEALGDGDFIAIQGIKLPLTTRGFLFRKNPGAKELLHECHEFFNPGSGAIGNRSDKDQAHAARNVVATIKCFELGHGRSPEGLLVADDRTTVRMLLEGG